MTQSQLIYKDKVIQGIHGKYLAERDLTLAELTKNLEFPESSSIEAIEACFQKLASANSMCALIETMFAPDQEEEEQKCCKPGAKCDSPCDSPNSEP